MNDIEKFVNIVNSVTVLSGILTCLILMMIIHMVSSMHTKTIKDHIDSKFSHKFV